MDSISRLLTERISELVPRMGRGAAHFLAACEVLLQL